MKSNKKFMAIIITFLVLIVGCTNRIKIEGDKIEGDKIVVEKRVFEKRVDDADKYEFFNEISDYEEVENAKKVLESISWENAAVSMAHPPDYKFHFESTNQDNKSNELIYELWISPSKGRIELVIDSESKYVHLNKEKSAKLFQIITGQNLSDD